MMNKGGFLRQICSSQSCECSILPEVSLSEMKENLFLAPASPGHVVGRHPQVFRRKQTKNKARKSLRQKKGQKQDISSYQPSEESFQPKSMTSNSIVMGINIRNPRHSLIYNIQSQRSPLITIENCPELSYNSSNVLTTNQKNVQQKNTQQTSNSSSFKRNTIQIKISNNCQLKQNEKNREICIKQPRMDRVQSSGNIVIPKLKLNELPPRKGVQWRSQFVNVQLQKSTGKLTHRLTDLNMKCTESINDSESLRISEVVSQSESNRSDTNRTETLPKRIKDLMHMKYSKMQGKRY